MSYAERAINKNLHIKSGMVIDSVTGWFEIAQYEDKEQYQSLTYLKQHECIDTLD